jgi:hypothetical protein
MIVKHLIKYIVSCWEHLNLLVYFFIHHHPLNKKKLQRLELDYVGLLQSLKDKTPIKITEK